MTNQDVAKILYEISELLEIKEVPFKPRAYEKAAISIEGLDENLKDIYKKSGRKGFDDIPSVGISIAEKIEELLKTGKLRYYQKLKKEFPVDILEMTRIEGLGPKTVAELYKKLKIKNLEELEQAAKSGKIEKLAGFGKKSEENILAGMEFSKKERGRMLLSEALPVAENIINQLQKTDNAERIVVAGSIRRMQETIGDVDIVATSKTPKKLIDAFTKLPEVSHIYSKGATRSSVRLKIGVDADLRVVAPGVFGAALQYFTGDKQHNIAVRKIAIKKGYKLNEYGLFRGKKNIACKTEEEIYKKLGMDTPPPEIRTDEGEVEAAEKHNLPKLIDYDEIKGDLQMHTTWSDGSGSILEMAEKAKKMGYKYISITDHTKKLAIANGLDEKGLARHSREVDKINKKIKGLHIFKSAEVNIMKDGSLDIKNEALKKLDIVGAAVHSNFKMSKQEMTKRIIRAMQNPYLNILFHPTGRIIGRRPGYEIDIDEIINAAKKYGVVLEVDAYPNRLDLKDEYIRKAVKAGVMLSIDTDSHDKSHLKYMHLGIGQARRGWAKKSNILNTKSANELIKTLKKLKK
ncbi:DNA polymerase/3'-5' exonuclease PolX [Candidatus Parcubacteria bacterium]|nr:DNA polymerase/3'-5' exonuclease PolX [Patescibacteria group bacterium]MCG2694204.1 DNA polymerase/3'-5' exonuclease PolX [Candidatus Parcubacteria bacterium]